MVPSKVEDIPGFSHFFYLLVLLLATLFCGLVLGDKEAGATNAWDIEGLKGIVTQFPGTLSRPGPIMGMGKLGDLRRQGLNLTLYFWIALCRFLKIRNRTVNSGVRRGKKCSKV